jgi:lipoprotein-anchoring transpeptidase ErfK/SrfK
MLSRRHLLGSGLAALGLAATRAGAQEAGDVSAVLPPGWEPTLVSIPPGFLPGEIHVDPDAFALYWTLPGDMAIRYAVGIARSGLYEPGTYHVGAKKEWPSWTPTPDMVERDPETYGPYAETGMPGGPDNPLGARALYLFTPERGDTFMRIHGTNAPSTIGTAVSNGCVRLVNEHVVDLYERVPLDAPVILYPSLTTLGV